MKTIGGLFRDTQKELLEKTLCQRIEIVILQLLQDLFEFFDIDIEKSIYRLITSKEATQNLIILLSAVYQTDIGCVENISKV